MTRGGTVPRNGISCKVFAWPVKQRTPFSVAVFCQILVIRQTIWGGTTKLFNSHGQRRQGPLAGQPRL
jgi:hypothetical protein